MADNSIGLFTVPYDMCGRDCPSLSDHSTNVGLSPVIGILLLRRIGLAKPRRLRAAPFEANTRCNDRLQRGYCDGPLDH